MKQYVCFPPVDNFNSAIAQKRIDSLCKSTTLSWSTNGFLH